MSRNLMSSSCCGNVVRLGDLRGKPIEFRRYGSRPTKDEPPVIGTRWDCPTCQTAYFVIWRDAEWKDGFVERGFVLDLSYYESYNDEHRYDQSGDIEGLDAPEYQCLDNAEDVQHIW